MNQEFSSIFHHALVLTGDVDSFGAFVGVGGGSSAIVAKVGLKNVDLNAGFAVQWVVMLLLWWLYAGVTGKTRELSNLQAGEVWRVAPIDRLSLVFSIALAAVFLSEEVSPPVVVGASLVVARRWAALGETGATARM